MLRWLTNAALVCGVCWLLLATPAVAGPLDVRVKDLHAPAAIVSATVELRDVLPDRFRHVMDEGGVLHLQIQTELWESRRPWDRLVYPSTSQVLRLSRTQPGKDFAITSAAGTVSTYAALPNPMPVTVDIGGADRLKPEERYYVHTVATLGMLAEREPDESSDALFGRDSERGTLGSLGRLVFRRALQISDYLHSVTAEATTGKLQGRQILRAP